MGGGALCSWNRYAFQPTSITVGCYAQAIRWQHFGVKACDYDWRQYRYNLRQFKRLMRSAQSRSAAKTKQKANKKRTNDSLPGLYWSGPMHLDKIQITPRRLSAAPTEVLQKMGVGVISTCRGKLTKSNDVLSKVRSFLMQKKYSSI